MSAAWGTHLLVLALAGTLFMGLYQGLRAGLIQGAFKLVGLVLAFYLARPLADALFPRLEDHLQFSGGYPLLVFASFLLVAFAAGLIGVLVAKLIAWSPLVWLDRLGGAALGLVLALLIVGLILGFLDRMEILDTLLESAADWEYKFLTTVERFAPNLYGGWDGSLDPKQIPLIRDSI